MQAPQGPRPRSRSAFAAAFLSLIFPGLGHAYAGAPMRAIGFAAPPLLAFALLGGVAIRTNRLELIGFLIQPEILAAIFVVNIAFAIYRIAAVIDAWRVAHYLNEVDASGTGRLGRSRLPLSPISVAGMGVVILVLLGGHFAVAKYDQLAMSLVNCVFTDESTATCDDPSASEAPSDSLEPEPTDAAPSATEFIPTPIAQASGTPVPEATIPPWDGKEVLNILLVGSDQRPQEGTYNTDTMIVLSIDPKSGRTAMFQLPRDSANLPVPPQARSVWGNTYNAKVNSWFTANRNKQNLWPGKNSQQRGFAALKSMLGYLYGIDIKYYVEVNFQGFRDTVDRLGGLNVNVQAPVSDDRYPDELGRLRRLYIPAGPQHMTGTQALAYARSRHTTDDFDRGRRQQRVLLSLREQADIPLILSKLPELVQILGKSIHTDVPAKLLPQLLGLANQIDTRNLKSYVFTPSYYATQYLTSEIGYKIVPNVDRIRRAVAAAFKGDAQLEDRRERLGSEGGQVWVLNGTSQSGMASDIAGYLLYNGVGASAPNQRVQQRPQDTRIVVYNGAEAKMAATIAYLQALFKVTPTMATDPKVAADIVITTGQKTPDLEAPSAG
jgi:LCP family protein required for cell wall assembly